MEFGLEGDGAGRAVVGGWGGCSVSALHSNIEAWHGNPQGHHHVQHRMHRHPKWHCKVSSMDRRVKKWTA